MANLNFIQTFEDETPTHFKEKIQAWLYMSAGDKIKWELEETFGYKHSMSHGVKQLTIREDKGKWHTLQPIHFLMNGVQFAPSVPAYISFLKMRYTNQGCLKVVVDDRTLHHEEIDNFIIMDGFTSKEAFIKYHFKDKTGTSMSGIIIQFGFDFKL